MVIRRAARVVGLAGAAVAAGVFVSGGFGRRADAEAFRALNLDSGPAADRLSTGITELGSIWASIGAAAVLAAGGRRRAAAKGLGAASVAWLAGQGLKRVFLRPRPHVSHGDGSDGVNGQADVRLLIEPPHSTSWPSSHPAVLLAFVTVAGRELGLSRAARAGLTGLAAAVGVSRTHVGVHYPGDVVGGLLLGRAVADAWSRDGR